MNITQISSALALTLLIGSTNPAFAHSDKGHRKSDDSSRTMQSDDRRSFDDEFSRYDRDGDGRVTRSEFPGDTNQFNQFDLNRDGSISAGEAQRILGDPGAIESQVRQLDRNGDGVIARNEFPGDANAFDRLDRNRDGVLSESDRNEHGKKQKMNKRFNGLDRNNDGRITRSEWQGNDRSFRNHDLNGDGVISGRELTR